MTIVGFVMYGSMVLLPIMLQTLLGYEEVSYFVMFAWLGVAGPGPVSLDHLILKRLRPNRPASDYGA